MSRCTICGAATGSRRLYREHWKTWCDECLEERDDRDNDEKCRDYAAMEEAAWEWHLAHSPGGDRI